MADEKNPGVSRTGYEGVLHLSAAELDGPVAADVAKLLAPETIDALTAERDAARADVVAAAGELAIDLREAPPGSTVARLLVANRVLIGQRDANLSRAVDAENALAAMRSRAEAAEADWQVWQARAEAAQDGCRGALLLLSVLPGHGEGCMCGRCRQLRGVIDGSEAVAYASYAPIAPTIGQGAGEEHTHYILNGVVGNCAVWWRAKDAGYTCNLDDAGTYTLAEAQHRCRHDNWLEFPVPVASVRTLRHVHLDSIDVTALRAALAAHPRTPSTDGDGQ